MRELVDTRTISNALKTSPQVIVSRARRLGVGTLVRKKFWFNEEEVTELENFKRSYNNKNSKYNKQKIHIIDFFLTHKTNTSIDIAHSLDLSLSRVNTTLNEYLNNNNCIIVESKINKKK
jgi:hypothetical protein